MEFTQLFKTGGFQRILVLDEIQNALQMHLNGTKC
jgi:hypothetical protein